MNAYEKLQTARSQTRPTARSYIEKLFQERTELHGDRKYADDAAIIGGIGMLGDIPATFIGIERGRNLEERIRCNFGCPMPEGYRKALRLMRQAEKFHRPVICFVDTSGAFCGEEAEERGQGQAIADWKRRLSRLSLGKAAAAVPWGFPLRISCICLKMRSFPLFPLRAVQVSSGRMPSLRPMRQNVCILRRRI